MPKAMIEVKELKLDISKDGGSKPNLFVKLHILPIVIHMGEPRVSCDQSSNFNCGECIAAGDLSFDTMERASAPFSCEELSLSCEFGHDRYFLLIWSFPLVFGLFMVLCLWSFRGVSLVDIQRDWNALLY